MFVQLCIFRTAEGECRLENKACGGCKDAPAFIDWEGNEDDDKEKEEYED